MGGKLDRQFRWRCNRHGLGVIRLRIVLLILNTTDWVLWDALHQDLVSVNLFLPLPTFTNDLRTVSYCQFEKPWGCGEWAAVRSSMQASLNALHFGVQCPLQIVVKRQLLFSSML